MEETAFGVQRPRWLKCTTQTARESDGQKISSGICNEKASHFCLNTDLCMYERALSEVKERSIGKEKLE